MFMAKPSTLVILCGLCSGKNIFEGNEWHSTLKYNYFTECANIVHTSELKMHKPDKPGDFIIPCYVQQAPCGGLPQTTNFMRGGQVPHCAFLPVSRRWEYDTLSMRWDYCTLSADNPRKIFKQLSKNLQNLVSYIMWLYFVLCYGSLKVPLSRWCFIAEPMFWHLRHTT